MIEVKLTGIDGVLATLQSLPAEVVSKRGGPVKSALRKGALVILKAEKANLQAVMGHKVDGEERQSTGLVLKNLVVKRGKAPTSGKGERYITTVKRRVYARKSGKPVTTTQNAARLEYGARGGQQPAEPWIRPAVKARGAEAISTIERELVAGIDKVVAKLAAQNKGR
jgi:hypothetical protein